MCYCSISRSIAALLKATDTSSPEKILRGLRLVKTGLALYQRLQPTFAGGAALAEEERSLVQRSVSALCVRVCAAVLQHTANRAELVEAGVRDDLSAVLVLRAGLTR